MRNECTHRYSLDCCSPFAFHVSKGRLRTLGFTLPPLFSQFLVIVKHSKAMFEKNKKSIALFRGTSLHKQIFKRLSRREKESGAGIVTAAVCVRAS